MDNMTDNQMELIAWLITTILDKCETLEEVRVMNEKTTEDIDKWYKIAPLQCTLALVLKSVNSKFQDIEIPSGLRYYL